MKKLLVASAIALAMTANAQAENKEGEKWVAGFFEHYRTDPVEEVAPNFLTNGNGIGAEFGYRFKPEWAARLEVSRFDIGGTPTDFSSTRIGADALYFMPDDLLYAFGGLKITDIAEESLMFNLGIGKHWDLTDTLKAVTEVAAYQDLPNSNTHVGFKVGLAYTFGNTSSSTSSSSKDSDRDGVSDNNDRCANTPFGTEVDNFGCALPASLAKVGQMSDADSDGVVDSQDKCANTPSTDKVDAAGCSIFTEEQVSVDIKVLFSHNSAVVNYPLDPQLQEFAEFMKRFPATDTVIEGHASAPGDADYNMKLSEDRAKSVRKLFIERFGIDAARLSVKGYGETQLLDTSNTAAAHEKNRRITAVVATSKRVKVKK